MLRRVNRAGLTASAAVLALSGCSLGGDEERGRTEPAKGTPKQVAATVEELDRAVRKRDWRTVCDRLFTSAARERAGGRDCPRLVGSSAGELRRTRIELLEITVRRDTAEARVRTRARGQSALTDTLTLKRVAGRYRIDSLR
jgi:hypothetical protein